MNLQKTQKPNKKKFFQLNKNEKNKIYKITPSIQVIYFNINKKNIIFLNKKSKQRHVNKFKKE